MKSIINISDASSIAIHGMAVIANSTKPLQVHEIAKQTGFSGNHIAKIMQTLVKYNYLASTRGPKGGFTLNTKAKNINLLEIFELIEGKIKEESCPFNSCKCPFTHCIFGGTVEKYTHEFKNYLKEKKLSEIILKMSENEKDDHKNR